MNLIKLAEAPLIEYQSPRCGSCSVDLESEDGWRCPVCGTIWEYNASDGDPGELYESYSGETLDVAVTPEDDAWRFGYKYEEAQRQAAIERSKARAHVATSMDARSEEA